MAYERAIEGQLVPVIVADMLKGFRRLRNEPLLMLCLRINMRGEDGKRLAASYFDPRPSCSVAIGAKRTARLPGSAIPALSRAAKDNMNATVVENFDPVDMPLSEMNPYRSSNYLIESNLSWSILSPVR